MARVASTVNRAVSQQWEGTVQNGVAAVPEGPLALRNALPRKGIPGRREDATQASVRRRP